jgi:hypothetical protein
MPYDGVRSYIGTFTLAAQNVVMTASGAVAIGTTSLTNIPTGEATYIASICGLVTATPSAFPAGVKPYIVTVNGTTTATATGATAFVQTTLSNASSVFNPPAAVSGNIAVLGLVATGTASATQTLAATTLLVGLGPQFL